MYPKSLQNLIESFKYLPGIGEKTAKRLAFSVLDFENEKTEFFIQSLKSVNNNIGRCPKCNMIIENNKCLMCNDFNRNKEVMCVVEDPRNLFLIEDLQTFNGVYHVLDGLISPLDGINPEDIGLEKLLQRVKNENLKELILAFKPSIEGETTSLYIKSILEGIDIKITKLASGVPMGADMEYLDTLTLENALKERKEIT